MRAINKVFLYGHLGADPEHRQTASGKDVCTFNLATNRSIKVGDDWSEATDWHRIVSFDWQARRCVQRLHKGDAVALTGQLRTREWVDKGENKRRSVEVVIDTICFPSPARLQLTGEVEAPEPTLPNGALPETAEIPF